MGRVRLNSKRAAFSISAAKEGGATATAVAAARDRDLMRVEDERVGSWGALIVILGSAGSWEMEGLGFVVEREGEGGTRVLEEAMIMLAIAAAVAADWSLFFWEGVRGCVCVSLCGWKDGRGKGRFLGEGYLILCHTN
jgi:hypothetical protein